MKLREIIGSEKTGIKISEWKNGAVSRPSFPLSRAKARAYKWGSAYEWCTVRFSALGQEFCVLILCRFGREILYATLGLCGPKDTQVLCSYEFHGTEPGWHCHLTCESVTTVPAGAMRGPWMRRLPGAREFHRRKSFGISNRGQALQKVLDFYGISLKGPLL